MLSPTKQLYNMLKGKTVSVIGVGVSNGPLINMLADMNISVVARDKRPHYELGDIYSELKSKGVQFKLGDDYLTDIKEDIVFKTPGMRYDIPELVDAAKRGATITSEMEIFFELCPGEVIGVTGSDGKTTTTSLIYAMLRQQGFTCWLGGNIGTPLIHKLDEIHPNDKVVLELSSFQLHTMSHSPRISVITNITPNHLDMHKSMDEYIQAKLNIMSNQDARCKLVTNADNKITAALQNTAKGEVCMFSCERILPDGVYLLDNQIFYKGKSVLNTSDIILPGVHNIENYMAAIAAVWGYVDVDNILHVAKTFSGVEHRLEFVRELNGVRYYNDSIATTPTRARAGLYSFDTGITLIAGGYDKHLAFDEFGEHVVNKVNTLILIGQTAKDIENAVRAAQTKREVVSIIHCKDLRDAINTAKEKTPKGDVVLLSPACASFDMFPNFDVRGKTFKSIVNEL